MGSSWARARCETPSAPQKRAAPSIPSSRARLAIAGHPSLVDLPRQGASRASSQDAEPSEVIHRPRGSLLEEAVLAEHRLSGLDLHRPGPALLAIDQSDHVGAR